MSCALTWAKSKASWSACLKQSTMVCFNQEESVGMSFLEGDKKEGSRPSQVFGSIQIVPQGLHRTQGPVFFELSIYNGSQIRNSHRRHTLRTFSR